MRLVLCPTLIEPVLLTTVDATDLQVNGTSVPLLRTDDGRTLVFDLSLLGEGVNTLSIAAGTFLDWQGTPIEAFSTSFEVDLTAPRVIASSLLNGQLAETGTLTYLARFSGEIQAVSASDFTLSGPGGNRPPNSRTP